MEQLRVLTTKGHQVVMRAVGGFYFLTAGTGPYTRPCDCRKPGRGMIDRAARDHGLDPARSFVVGDTWLDIGLARAVGARGILVRTGAGAAWEARTPPDLAADAVVDNLAAATAWILTSLKSEVGTLKCR
jgi:histidinol phosphatase-like enzyme